MSSRRRMQPTRVVGLLWIIAVFVGGTFAASLGSRPAAGVEPATSEPGPTLPPTDGGCSPYDSAGPLPAGSQSITGQVTNGASPVPDVQVRITSTDGGQDTTLTTATGAYVFELLGDGTYFISFFDENGTYGSGFYDGASLASSQDDATSIPLTGSGATGINAVLQPETSSTVSGIVRDSLNQPVAGAEVTLHGTWFPLVGCANTGSDGSYTIPNLRSGAYSATATAAGYPQASPIDPSIVVPPSDASVDFKFQAVYSLSGLVEVASGDLVDNVFVAACETTTNACGYGVSGDTGTGAFDITGLAEGTYEIRYEDASGSGMYRTGYYGGDSVWVETAAEAVLVAVPGGPIVLRAIPAPHVSGTITAPGVPSGSISVNLCDDQGHFCFSAAADDLGLYSIAVPAAGTYAASIYDSSGTYPSGGFIGSGGTTVRDPINALPIFVDGSDVGPLDATLAPGGRISVHVTVAGVPFESAYVQLCSDELACSDAFNTDGSGNGTSPALWPGTYYVNGMGNDLAYWFDVDGPESLAFTNASPVNVTAGSTSSITLALPGPGAPTEAGETVAPVQVAPDDGSGNTPVSVTFADITESGTTSLTTSVVGDPVPNGFQVGLPAYYFDIATTAVFAAPVVVCVTYVPTSYIAEENLRLFHFDGTWQDITVLPVDIANDRICGSTNSLSPFVLAERTYQFSGFQGPKSPPKVNDAKAGDTIGLQFGLGGDYGLDVFADGTPTMRQIDCVTGAAIGSETAATGSLKYAAKKATYTYGWVTLKAWKNTCRQVTVTFRDGTTASLWYRLKP